MIRISSSRSVIFDKQQWRGRIPMKKFISVSVIALLTVFIVDTLAFSLTNSIINNIVSFQTAYAEGIEFNPSEIITKASKLTKVEITAKRFTLAPGNTRQLAVKKTPVNASLLSKTEWGSGNDEIAAVDKNGKVTAKKEGIIVIWYRTWSKKDYSDCKYASTICYVSKKAPSAAVFKSNDFRITIDGVRVDFSLSYNQVKKLFPGGKDDKNYYINSKNMAYIVSDKNYTYSYEFLFKKTGDGNRKLLGAMCYYNGGGPAFKTPRGINSGSSTIIDAVNTYGYPSHCDDGYYLGYEVKIGKDKYTLKLFGERGGYTLPDGTIFMIGIAKNT
jgi:hypothetical protein